jgi:RNA polymerase sigma-70 factor (ECF subfamily)
LAQVAGVDIGALSGSFLLADADPHEQASRAERRRLLEAAVRRLPEKQRAALVLRDIEDFSTREVARFLDSSEATVRSQVSTARLKIHKLTKQTLRGRP